VADEKTTNDIRACVEQQGTNPEVLAGRQVGTYCRADPRPSEMFP